MKFRSLSYGIFLLVLLAAAVPNLLISNQYKEPATTAKILKIANANHAYSGFAPYWVGSANTFAVYSHGRITVAGIQSTFQPWWQVSYLYFANHSKLDSPCIARKRYT